ncbi:bifunctional non-homologous end joining protein LigD [Micromonospora pattaloongensis]|uniref:Bifunctional non-homologous end joining protein LigD n=1 Tax=Micromonospora pattaloongensis TaxID=405436 RepID=A0A1H3JDS7_9ACTN|nr:non-homologous end-joining DNA ligase [Micromonospora pattaloongensis]SDY38017.1 bifunctional non-homologous end joining protein LigD [Micromonospora pattaloongensis]
MDDELTVSVGARRLRVSSLERVLYPETGFSKAELIDYYTAVADVVLPHVRGHAITLHRYPSGVGGPHFYQTRCPPHPDWVRTATLHFPKTGKTFEAPVLDDVAALVWAANLATIELHPFLACAERIDHPTQLVFDLDPGPPAGFGQACAVALELRGMLAEVGLRAWPKTSGLKGLHLHVPLDGAATYAQTKAFARAVAATLARAAPGRVVDRMARALRAGKVFIDWSQNDAGKSTVAPYSLRGGARPTVAAPISWEDVADAAERDRPPPGYGPAAVRRRLAERGDLLAPLLATRQRLPS